MKIERKYKGEGVWEEITEGEFLNRTEWAGYWKKGTALDTLKEAGELATPWAIFRIKKESRDFLGDPTLKSHSLSGWMDHWDGLD